jgi:peptide/nickel transport system substrate-binding protein
MYCAPDGTWSYKDTNAFMCGCYIATATYGSELSPEVQLLRNFRDQDVLQTYAGSEGMKVFNLIYYSFSPQVAEAISANENLRTAMRYLLYPLIGILWVSQQIYSALAFGPEGAVVVAGVFTGGMIGLLYTLPFYGFSLAVSRAFRRRLTAKHVTLSLVLLATASTLIVVSEVTRFSLLMQLSTSLLALTAAALPGITFTAWALNRHRSTSAEPDSYLSLKH